MKNTVYGVWIIKDYAELLSAVYETKEGAFGHLEGFLKDSDRDFTASVTPIIVGGNATGRAVGEMIASMSKCCTRVTYWK
jgi:hypothetical protein